MDRKSPLVRLSTLVFCFGLMGLFVAYESGYIGRKKKPHLSTADDHAVFKQGDAVKFPTKIETMKPRVTTPMFATPTEMMSSSKTIVIDQSTFQGLFSTPSASFLDGKLSSNTIASNQ